MGLIDGRIGIGAALGAAPLFQVARLVAAGRALTVGVTSVVVLA